MICNPSHMDRVQRSHSLMTSLSPSANSASALAELGTAERLLPDALSVKISAQRSALRARTWRARSWLAHAGIADWRPGRAVIRDSSKPLTQHVSSPGQRPRSRNLPAIVSGQDFRDPDLASLFANPRAGRVHQRGELVRRQHRLPRLPRTATSRRDAPRAGGPCRPSPPWRDVGLRRGRPSGRASRPAIAAPASPHWLRHAHGSHVIDRGACAEVQRLRAQSQARG